MELRPGATGTSWTRLKVHSGSQIGRAPGVDALFPPWDRNFILHSSRAGSTCPKSHLRLPHRAEMMCFESVFSNSSAVFGRGIPGYAHIFLNRTQDWTGRYNLAFPQIRAKHFPGSGRDATMRDRRRNSLALPRNHAGTLSLTGILGLLLVVLLATDGVCARGMSLPDQVLLGSQRAWSTLMRESRSRLRGLRGGWSATVGIPLFPFLALRTEQNGLRPTCCSSPDSPCARIHRLRGGVEGRFATQVLFHSPRRIGECN